MGTVLFVDALGRRFRATDPDGAAVDVFQLSPEASASPSAEMLLAERSSRLAAFKHPAFASIRRVERAPGTARQWQVISTAPEGVRLSDLLRQASARGIVPSPGAIRCLLWQVLSAMADFHHVGPDLSHGAIGPERVVVSPDGRVVIVEHGLAPLLEHLRMGRSALWHTFQVAAPPSAGCARLDQMTDVFQLGMLALAVVLGRPIGREEYPHGVEHLLADAAAPAVAGHQLLGSKAMRAWLLRACQVQARSSFRTAGEAAVAFESVMADEPRHRSQPSAVVAFVTAVGRGAAAQPGRPADAAPRPGAGDPPDVGGLPPGGARSPQAPAQAAAALSAIRSRRPLPAAVSSSTWLASRSGWSVLRRRVRLA